MFVNGYLSLARTHTTTTITAINDFKTELSKEEEEEDERRRRRKKILCVVVCAVHVTHSQLKNICV